MPPSEHLTPWIPHPSFPFLKSVLRTTTTLALHTAVSAQYGAPMAMATSRANYADVKRMTGRCHNERSKVIGLTLSTQTCILDGSGICTLIGWCRGGVAPRFKIGSLPKMWGSSPVLIQVRPQGSRHLVLKFCRYHMRGSMQRIVSTFRL